MATITASRTNVLSALHDHGFLLPAESTTAVVADLGPDHFGQRVVIRSRDFLGTVCGILLYAYPHPTLINFTCVKLVGKSILTFRSDVETLVVE